MDTGKGDIKEIIFKALCRIPLFNGLPAEALANLFQFSGVSYYKKGITIIREGEIGDRVFIVASGCVKIFKGNPPRETVLKMAGPSEVIGEMSLLDGLPRSASAVIEEEAILFFITKEQFLNFIKTFPGILLRIIESLSLKVREKDDKIILLEALVIDNLNNELIQGDYPADTDSPADSLPLDYPGMGFMEQEEQEPEEQDSEENEECTGSQGDFYLDKKFVCPACRKETHSLVVKKKYARVESIDPDMCMHYHYVNPNFYKVVVCSHCRFAFAEETPHAYTAKSLAELRKYLSSLTLAVDFSGVRTMEAAIEAYKMAIACQTAVKASSSLLATLNLSLSCLYRQKGATEEEKQYLNEALHCYKSAVSKESFSNSSREIHIIYMIGEIKWQLGYFSRSADWFKKIISHPESGSNPYILNKAMGRWEELEEKGIVQEP